MRQRERSPSLYGRLMVDPQLTWTDLESMLIREFADESNDIEATPHEAEKSPRELGVSAE